MSRRRWRTFTSRRISNGGFAVAYADDALSLPSPARGEGKSGSAQTCDRRRKTRGHGEVVVATTVAMQRQLHRCPRAYNQATAHSAAIDAQCAAHSARFLSPFGKSSRTLARRHTAGIGDTSKTGVRIGHPFSFFVGAANRLINLRADFGWRSLRQIVPAVSARGIICCQAEQWHGDTCQKYDARFHDFSPSGLG